METRTNLAGAIYGTVLATSLVAAFSEAFEYSAFEIAVSVFVTGVVFWLAHVHSRLFAERYTVRRPLTRDEIKRAFQAEWPMVQAVVPPTLVLLLGALGVFSRETSIDLALGVGIGALVAWGLEMGRRERMGPLHVIGVTLTNVFFGVAIVVLKAVIH
jgi:hypothetical protein